MAKRFNYPNKKQIKKPRKAINYANRGKGFENDIIRTNNGYLSKGWAFVEKVEPAVQIQQDLGNKVIGFKKEKGFVDFFGCSHGRPLAFEAKKTTSRTSFPLSNIKQHQMDVLKFWQDQGGIAFFLIQFEKLHEVYFVHYEQVNEWWIQSKAGGRKSIPYSYFMMECDLVKTQRGVPYDYLSCI
ncbi:Holliday junction resolvase RecU [Peribacillus frigoritolerans]|uniref:Holliday junction resolvase RecU n=1 Tax=Peribacillus frigoritolerans TaxID=450367 RepID=UPI0021D0DEDD|nr:Holliday junction resolvase RecU [Peribacillus frigoritolerans]MCU6603782.1 Holliday junction resolvase RecU [Peribacillus frigoritolerans]